jgi:hypothetical protein
MYERYVVADSFEYGFCARDTSSMLVSSNSSTFVQQQQYCSAPACCALACHLAAAELNYPGLKSKQISGITLSMHYTGAWAYHMSSYCSSWVSRQLRFLAGQGSVLRQLQAMRVATCASYL